jgi:LacI family transcriptional regulator, galactose operon repressor
MSKAPTIIDVARHAQVSMKTVSRVLNDEPHVSNDARTRVLEAARALSYRPNMFARSLAGTRSWLIGLVCAPPSPAPAYVMTVQQGVLAACEARGYNLAIRSFDADTTDVAESVTQFVGRSRADGLIVVPPLADNEVLIRSLVGSGIAHVRVSQADFVEGSERVGTDETEIAAELTRYLVSLGHTNIAFIRGHPAHSGSSDRLQGYRMAMREGGIEPPEALVEQGMFSFESGFECGMRLLTGALRPTAIFASNDYMAAGVVNAAHRLGIAIPGELSVAGFDDAPVAHQIWPGLTTVRQPVRELGERATDRLIDMLCGRDTPAPGSELKCALVIRDSTGSIAD